MIKDHSSKRIINYDKDLPFIEFAELLGDNFGNIETVFEKKTGRIPTMYEKINFDTASLLIHDIDEAINCGPLITYTILKRGRLRSSKTLKQILVGEKIAIDAYPFDKHNRTLECISRMCNDSLSGGDWGNFKVFQMKDPETIFIIGDGHGFNYINFTYYGGFYHLDNPIENLRLLDNKELTFDLLYGELEQEMERYDKYNKVINYIITHKDEYVTANDGKKSHNIDWIASNLKNGNTWAHESKQLCDKCGKSLLSVYCETSGINYSTYYIAICPNCKIDYGIDLTEDLVNVMV